MDQALALAMIAAVIVLSVVPVLIVAAPQARRSIYFYGWLTTVLVAGGLMGQVFVVNVSAGVSLSAGSILYGAFMMAAVLFVWAERDFTILRAIIGLVIVVDLFKFGLFSLTAWALTDVNVVNPLDVPVELFSVSVRFLPLGGILIALELAILLFSFEQIKRRFDRPVAKRIGYVAAFAAVIVLDGVLFPVLAFPFEPGLTGMIAGGVESKALLALGYSVPMLLALIPLQGTIAAYDAVPLRLGDVFSASRDELLATIQDQDQERLRLLERMASISTTERTRLAESLHDDAVQLFAAVDLRLSAVASRTGAADELAPARELLQQGKDSLRRLVLELDAGPMTPSDFDRRVTAYAELMLRPAEIEFEVSATIPDETDPELVSTTYSIVQESLSNIARHSDAARASVRIIAADGWLRGQITDDGRGIDEAASSAPGHMGLRLVHERATSRGGHADVGPAEASGTRVEFALPLR